MRTVPRSPTTVMLLSKLPCGTAVLKVNVPHPPSGRLNWNDPPSSNSVESWWIWLVNLAVVTSTSPNTHIRMSKKCENWVNSGPPSNAMVPRHEPGV